MLGKRKYSFIEEANSYGETVDSCTKELVPHFPVFAMRLYREKKKGFCMCEGG